MTLATGHTAPATPHATSRAALGTPGRPLLAGTRGSPLALIQTRDFLDRVRAAAAVSSQEDSMPRMGRIRFRPLSTADTTR